MVQCCQPKECADREDAQGKTETLFCPWAPVPRWKPYTSGRQAQHRGILCTPLSCPRKACLGSHPPRGWPFERLTYCLCGRLVDGQFFFSRVSYRSRFGARLASSNCSASRLLPHRWSQACCSLSKQAWIKGRCGGDSELWSWKQLTFGSWRRKGKYLWVGVYIGSGNRAPTVAAFSLGSHHALLHQPHWAGLSRVLGTFLTSWPLSWRFLTQASFVVP